MEANVTNAPVIAQARVFPMKLDMPVPFRVAYGATTTAEPTIVELKLSDGTTALGEGSAMSSSTPAQRKSLLEITKDLAQSLVGKSADAALDHIAPYTVEYINTAPTAFAACEIALFDLKARLEKKPLHKLFGNANLTGIDTDITLPLLSEEETISFWQRYAPYNFRILKIKVKGDLDYDVAHVQRILKLAPQGTQYLIDGNQGFTADGACALVQTLKKLNLPSPLFFEQPLPKDAWSDLKSLAGRLPIPLCLDETIATAADAERAVREKTSTMINLKVMKSGIRETQRIINVASKAGIAMMIGGMVETEIAMSASLHMLCGTGAIRYADLDTPFFIRDRITKTSPWHRNQASLVCEQTFGLGLELCDGI
jgi:L-alanine-DL-glutamate epimerase-like enolase superfamily enzyme